MWLTSLFTIQCLTPRKIWCSNGISLTRWWPILTLNCLNWISPKIRLKIARSNTLQVSFQVFWNIQSIAFSNFCTDYLDETQQDPTRKRNRFLSQHQINIRFYEKKLIRLSYEKQLYKILYPIDLYEALKHTSLFFFRWLVGYFEPATRFISMKDVIDELLPAGNFTCLAVVFNLRRRLGYHLFHTYIPSGLIVVMSWISFWIKPEAIPARITLGVTSLLTLGINKDAQLVNKSWLTTTGNRYGQLLDNWGWFTRFCLQPHKVHSHKDLCHQYRTSKPSTCGCPLVHSSCSIRLWSLR